MHWRDLKRYGSSNVCIANVFAATGFCQGFPKRGVIKRLVAIGLHEIIVISEAPGNVAFCSCPWGGAWPSKVGRILKGVFTGRGEGGSVWSMCWKMWVAWAIRFADVWGWEKRFSEESRRRANRLIVFMIGRDVRSLNFRKDVGFDADCQRSWFSRSRTLARGSRRRRFNGGCCWDIVIERALGSDTDHVDAAESILVRLITTWVYILVVEIFTGMAPSIWFPIPITPTSVSRNDVRCTLGAFYAERPLLVDLDNGFSPVPRISFHVFWGSRVLATASGNVAPRGGVASCVAGCASWSVDQTVVPFAGTDGILSIINWRL